MQHGEAAQAALHVGIDALEWPDSDAVHKAIIFCAAVVNVAALAGDSQLQEVVGKDMFSAAIRGLTLESNASAQAELVGLLRDIYLRLGTRSATPRQVIRLFNLLYFSTKAQDTEGYVWLGMHQMITCGVQEFFITSWV
jgi:exportin-5